MLDAATRSLRSSLANLQDSPILSTAIFMGRHLLTSSMSGQLLVSDLDGRTIDRRRDHSKYVVKVAIHHDDSEPLIATAGWDCKVNIYKPSVTGRFSLGEATASITLQTKPEAMICFKHPESSQPVLIISRTDSNHLLYYSTEPEPRLLGKQNLAPHSNAWVAFTPSALALCPTDPTLIAVGTSTVPHMKLLLVRLLVPPYEQEADASDPAHTTRLRTSLLDDSPATETQASQARAALALADREAAAIQIHCTTLAPQTAYSTPAVAWRPDGSGIWVNGDDGAVRGIEASSGKVIVTLQGGHEAGSKVRCLWAGEIEGKDGGMEEVLVSGGFDQRLIVWQVEKEKEA
jgi:WD40 repeat protein